MVRHQLDAAGIDASKAQAICDGTVKLMRAGLGGASFYFPKQQPNRDTDKLAAEVYEEWRVGKSARQIARERGFTPAWAHQLIARERQRREGVEIK